MPEYVYVYAHGQGATNDGIWTFLIWKQSNPYCERLQLQPGPSRGMPGSSTRGRRPGGCLQLYADAARQMQAGVCADAVPYPAAETDTGPDLHCQPDLCRRPVEGRCRTD